jgi:hypothetical protein
MYAPIPLETNNDEIIKLSENPVTIRQMHTDEKPSANMPILIMDNATDISMVGRNFEILFYTGERTTLWGAMAALDGCNYDIVTTATIAQNPVSTQEYILVINQAAYVPDLHQHECLLHTDQARHHNIIINDLGKFFRDGFGNPGKQSIEVDGFQIPLQHDGSKYFLTIWTPTMSDWDELPIVELTSPIPWCNTIGQIWRMRENREVPLEIIQEWSERLGHLNTHATKHT